MGRDQDGDMTGRDPLSSAAEGDDQPDGAGDDQAAGDGFAAGAPHPEALDDTPVTDAPPASGLDEA